MDILDFIKFFKEEIPAHSEEICTALDLLVTTVDNSKVAIDSRIAQMLSKDDYIRAYEFMEVSKGVSELNGKLKEYLEQLSQLTPEEEEENEEEVVEQDQAVKIDYEQYRIDDSIAYNLYSNFTHKKPAAFVFEGNKYMADKWKTMLLETCRLLWEKDSKLFTTFTQDEKFNGRKRMYFSKNSVDLREPRQIDSSNIYVETNMSANHIRNIIIKMLESFEIPRSTYQIYLCKDYTELHK